MLLKDEQLLNRDIRMPFVVKTLKQRSPGQNKK